MIQSLNKKWKEFLFAFSGFGPNFLMVLMGAYYSDALDPSALEAGEQFQSIMPGVCFILPALFPILFAIGKAFDGIIDIPFAHITDTLSTKWGRRRPTIAVCFLPMVISFVMCWIPIGGVEGKLLNTLWVTFFSIIFFASYTMCLISFYGSLSTVCTTESQRLRVSGYKSFFDTISYCFVYALVPVVLSGAKMQIDTLVFILTPLMLTMIIPLFLIKEGEKYGYPENKGLSGEKVTILESLKLTFKNTAYRRWTYVNCCSFFGLQMFLSAMNGLIIGGMGMSGGQMALLNTFAFAPVPLCLYLFNKVKAKWGIRKSYQSCLLAFGLAIFSFLAASRFVLGEGNTMLKIAIGITGSLCASWSIGIFFMMPYLAAAQISGVEERLTGKNHSAMYFAGNALTTSIVGAISGTLVYETIKHLFISKKVSGIVWATGSKEAYSQLHNVLESTVTDAQATTVYNLGNLLVPIIVSVTCIAGFFIAFKMPRDFSAPILARELKKQYPDLDISELEAKEVKPEKEEIIFVQIGLSILSGFVFGFIWCGFLMRSVKELSRKFKAALPYLAGCLVPLLGIWSLLKMRGALLDAAKEKGVEIKISIPLIILTSLLLPLLPLNFISLAVVQHAANKLHREA